MTHKQKVQYTQIALGLVGLTVDEPAAELIITTLDAMKAKGGEFSLRDAARIRAKIEEKYKRLAKRKPKSND